MININTAILKELIRTHHDDDNKEFIIGLSESPPQMNHSLGSLSMVSRLTDIERVTAFNS